MSIIEYHGGPVTHKYLMGKYSKYEMANEILDYLRAIELYKRDIAKLKREQPDSADKKCICEYPYLNFLGCPQCNPNKLAPVG